MFEDIIQEKPKKLFNEAEFAGMDGTCVFCPASNPHLCFEDCTNYEQDDPERIHQYPDVCKYYVGNGNCTFHRY